MTEKDDLTEIERWQIEEIKKGLKETEAGDFATDEEIRDIFAKLLSMGTPNSKKI